MTVYRKIPSTNALSNSTIADPIGCTAYPQYIRYRHTEQRQMTHCTTSTTVSTVGYKL